MKRPLSVFLCVLLLLGLVSLPGPAARMVTMAAVSALPNVTTAAVGDGINWGVEPIDGLGPFTYRYSLARDGSVIHQVTSFDSMNNILYWRFTEPGIYRISFTIHDGSDNSELTVSGSEVAARFAPTPSMCGARPSSPLGTSLKVTWAAVGGASLYEVWRASARFGPYALVRLTSSTVVYDTGLTPGKQAFYKVRSAIPVNTVPLALGLPGAALMVTLPTSAFSAPVIGVPISRSSVTSASAAGRERVTLTWSAAPGATAYKVWVSKSPASGYTLARATAATALTVAGLDPDTAYFFKIQPYVQAYPRVYDGPMSGYSAVRTLK